ncbi:MAG: tripartite tricarboxylate transporter substrate-binding protein [Hyphomicrobiaceae bacterium]
MSQLIRPSRRALLAGGVSLGATATLPTVPAFGQSFPSQNIKVMVATREGGDADRNLRAFWSVWKKYLKTDMEVSFFPGAAGRVGYEKYMGLAQPDCYTLLFGNMAPEVLNWVVKPPTSFKFPGDYKYFLRVDSDPSCVLVRKDSPIRTLADLVAEGKKKTLKVAASRIAHPASVGMLAIAKATGAKVNIVPLSGGRNTMAAIASGEMDCGALPTSGVAQRLNAFRILGVFEKKNRATAKTGNAPTVNDALGLKIPTLNSARAFAIKTTAIQQHPARFKMLEETAKKVFADPDYKAAIEKLKAPWEYIDYGDLKECEEEVKDILAIGQEFRALLAGKA